MMENREKQQVFTFENLEPENFFLHFSFLINRVSALLPVDYSVILLIGKFFQHETAAAISCFIENRMIT